jgi:predicted secreted protein
LVQQSNIIACPGVVQPTINFTTNVDPVTSYSWSVTNSAALGLASGTGVTGNIPGWTFAANNTGTDIPGIATVAATKGGCTSPVMTFGISVRAQPVLTNPGNQTYCPGVPVTINWISNVPGSTITWSNSNPAIGIGAGPNNGDISFTTAPNNTGVDVVGTITATATRSGCTSVVQSFTITVSPIPVLTQQANITACPGTNQTAINFVTNADPVTTYSWSVTNSALLGMGSGVGTGSSIPAWTFAANNTGADIIGVATVTATKAGCTSAVMSFNITLSAQPVLTAQSDVTYCPGAPININFVSNVPGAVISWSNANTAIGIGVSGNGNLSFTAPANLTALPIVSTVDVNAIHSGCVSPTMSFTITINPSPQFTITNNTPIICEGTPADITLNSITSGAVVTLAAVNYNGAIGTPLLAGATFTDGQQITEILTNPTNLPINVVYTFSVSANGCNNPFTQTATITVKPLPSATASSATICSGQNDFVLITAGPENVAGTTFDWTYTGSANVIGASNGNGSTINQNLSLSDFVPGTVQYTITPTANGCVGPQTVVNITVNPIPLVNAGADFQVCEPATIALSGSIGGAATAGTWILVTGSGTLGSSTTAGTSVTATYTVNPSDVTNTLTFRLNSNDPDGAGPCSAASGLVHVTVNRSATVTLPADFTICEPVSFAATPINLTGTIGGSAISGLWSVISGSGGLSATNVSGTTVSANYVMSPSDVGNTLTFRLTSNDPDGLGPCTPIFKDINIHINQRAVVSAGPNLSLCQDTPSIALQGSFGGSTTSVTWTGGAGAYGNSTSPVSTYSFVPAEVNTSFILTLTTSDPDGAGPCGVESDQMTLTINKLPTVVFFGLPPSVAENNAPLTLSGNQVGGLFTISPLTSNIGSTVPTPTGNAIFNPGAATLGLNQITYTYTDPATTCTNQQVQTVIVNPVTNIDFGIAGATVNASNEFELCNHQPSFVKINGFPSPTTGLGPETQFTSSLGQTYGGTLPIIINSGEYYIDTNVPSDTYFITYTYKNTVGAITSLTKVLRLQSVPTSVIAVANSCISSAISFTDASTMPATPFPTTITGWKWDFSDGSFSNLQNVSHFYGSAGIYNINLEVTTAQGCKGNSIKAIRVGDVPIVDFSWSAICNNDSTKFIDKTNPGTVSVVQTYTWTFGDGDVLTGPASGSVPVGTNGGRTSGSFKKPDHKYVSFGTYNTKLVVTTNDGCTNSQIQKVFILPYSTVTPLANSAYVEGFELSNGGWIAEAKQPSDTSWIWGPPTGAHINVAASGTKVWWTGKNSNSYFANEQSTVNGPCFDLRNLNRPMVSMDIWSDSEHNLDGAVLQYSTDGGVNWRIVGPPEGQLSRDEGINWFDGQGIPSNPGLQPIGNYGWTDPTGGWKNARFNLDMVPKIDRDQVRIRVAYGSNSTNPPGVTLDGFAFDNVFVGDKARNVLVEHFTNSSLKASTDGDAQVEKLYQEQFTIRDSTDFHYVQYHIGFPGADPLNADNPADPASRSLYFGVSQPPATIMDGILDGVKFKGSYNDLNRVELDRRALKDPLFNLVLTESTAASNNMISVGLDITANQNFGAPLIAQVLLVENQTGTFKNVLRKQLFGADGQTISNTFTKGGPAYTHSRNNIVIDVPITNPAQLTLIAYVQDKNTKEIYQSVIIPASTKQGAPVTGIEPVIVPTTLNGITLYPNPATGSFNLGLPEGKTATGFSWKLIDQRGIVLKSGDFEDLINQTRTVDISNLANGIYIVAISGPGQSVVYQKLVVLNGN